VESVARAAFAQRRKTVSNSIRGSGLAGLPHGASAREDVESALSEAGVDPGERAERIEPERFAGLARVFADRGWV